MRKFGKVWAQTEITVRLAFAERGVSRIAYFNWIWVHTPKENTAATLGFLGVRGALR